MSKFTAKNGSRLDNEQAEIIGERIEALSQFGIIHPVDLVNDARPLSSPIHDYFEWDDAEAAEAYRREQARYYLRSICIKAEGLPEPVRAFQQVRVKITKTGFVAVDSAATEEDGQNNEVLTGFLPLHVILDSRDLLRQVINDAARALRESQKRLAQYERLRGVAEGAVQQALDELSAIMQTEEVLA